MKGRTDTTGHAHIRLGPNPVCKCLTREPCDNVGHSGVSQHTWSTRIGFGGEVLVLWRTFRQPTFSWGVEDPTLSDCVGSLWSSVSCLVSTRVTASLVSPWPLCPLHPHPPPVEQPGFRLKVRAGVVGRSTRITRVGLYVYSVGRQQRRSEELLTTRCEDVREWQ